MLLRSIHVLAVAVGQAEMLPQPVADGWPEREILEALARADRERALTLLMQAYGRPLYQFCLGVTGDPSVAEEVHQMTFVQAFEGLGSFGGRSSSKTWLFGIARHRCLDALKVSRRRGKRFPLVAEPPDGPAGEPSAETLLAGRATSRALAECLDELPSKARAALVLRYQQNLAYPEIAAVSGERAATLQARVVRSLPLLRRCLEAKGHAP